MRSEAPAVASVFDVEPRFIGGTETYARELSIQLGRHGWRSVLCFASSPPEDVRRFLALPNVSFEVVDFVRGSKLRVLPPRWKCCAWIRRWAEVRLRTSLSRPLPWL